MEIRDYIITTCLLVISLNDDVYVSSRRHYITMEMVFCNTIRVDHAGWFGMLFRVFADEDRSSDTVFVPLVSSRIIVKDRIYRINRAIDTEITACSRYIQCDQFLVELLHAHGSESEHEDSCLKSFTLASTGLEFQYRLKDANQRGIHFVHDLQAWCGPGAIQTNSKSSTSPECEHCAPGKFGVDCKGECNNCVDDNCYRTTGVCVQKYKCKDDKHTGFKCDTTCTAGRFGLSGTTSSEFPCRKHCRCSEQSTCHAITGKCQGRCQPLYYGPACQQSCSNGYYGDACDQRCDCREDKNCFHDGQCPVGFVKICNGKYGQDCTLHCHCRDGSPCDPATGKCPLGCAMRRYGDDCQEECPIKKYAINDECTGECHCKQETDDCNATTGVCPHGCAIFYKDAATPGDCQKRCEYGKTCGSDSKTCYCLSGEQNCDIVTGKCPDGCANRKKGDNCQLTCPPNKWGKGKECNQKCHCKHADLCHVESGRCIGGCDYGRHGESCEYNCSDSNSENVIECQAQTCNCLLESQDCDIKTRVCRGLCNYRYIGGYGKRCTKKCDLGKYLKGLECIGICHCKTPELCNVTNGVCGGECAVGWVAPGCKRKCEYGPKSEKCAKECQCEDNNSCDPLTGYCPGGRCKMRNYGTDCQKTCKVGFFEKHNACKGICHCEANSSCRAKDGKCTEGGCYTGYSGEYCETRCNFGRRDQNCNEMCHCQNDDFCNEMSGECPNGCDIRYYGKACRETCPKGSFNGNPDAEKCQQTCRCLNPAKCKVTNGVCIGGRCRSGWEGDDCQRKCDDKHYGKNCINECHCKDDAACDKKTGQCQDGCHHRWVGYRCDNTCTEGFFKVHGKCDGECHCFNQSACQVTNGQCLNTICAAGWDDLGEQNPFCNKKCTDQKYGVKCNQLCHCLNDATCDHITGHCLNGCNHRYTGPNCDVEPCGVNKFLNENGLCTEDCLCEDARSCRVIDGLCTSGGCKSGSELVVGSKCREACEAGKYSLGELECNNICQCMNNHTCDPVTGECFSGCSSRYTGRSCNQTCQDGTFDTANKCSKTCRCAENKECNVVRGSCGQKGCAKGYRGEFCQNECDNNWYGDGCHSRCQCANNEQCDHVTGKCPDGIACNGRHDKNVTTGLCYKPCSHGRYRIQGDCSGICMCTRVNECNVISGHCGKSGCLAGYKGDDCQLRCIKKYGSKCENRCHCYGDVSCDPNTGKCPYGCDLRHSGEACQTTCPVGMYHPVSDSNNVIKCNKRCNCYGNADCDITGGYCPNLQCVSVRFGGADCQITCANRDRYLLNQTCTGVCYCFDKLCNVMNGSCGGGSCKSGWKGDKCNEKCPNGKFGRNCQLECNCKFGAACHHKFGSCENGCTEGFVGPTCHQKASYSKVTRDVGIYGGSILAILLIAIGIGFAATLQKRRNKRRMMSRFNIGIPTVPTSQANAEDESENTIPRRGTIKAPQQQHTEQEAVHNDLPTAAVSSEKQQQKIGEDGQLTNENDDNIDTDKISDLDRSTSQNVRGKQKGSDHHINKERSNLSQRVHRKRSENDSIHVQDERHKSNNSIRRKREKSADSEANIHNVQDNSVGIKRDKSSHSRMSTQSERRSHSRSGGKKRKSGSTGANNIAIEDHVKGT